MRQTCAALLTLLLLLVAPARGEEAADNSRAPAQWDVADPGGPYRTFETVATQGTWMSLDIHPDGTRLVFDLLGDLYVLPLAGGRATRITEGLPYDVQPRWSPDGTRILFTSDRGGGDNLWTCAPDGSDARAITKETFRLFSCGAWHPSGTYVVGRKHFTSRRSIGAGEMWLVHVPEGGEGVRLTERKNEQQDAGQPCFSPDGRYLYWCEDMSGGESFEYNKDPHGVIYVVRRMDMDTGEVRDLIRRPGGAATPQVSPDGTRLAYVRRVRSKSVLSLYDLETGEVRDLFDGLSLDQQESWAIFGPYPHFDWTPDGNEIVIWGQGRLNRVRVDTGAAQEIPFEAHVSQRLLPLRRIEHEAAPAQVDVKVLRWPQLTDDGRTAVFQALGVLWRRDIASGSTARLTMQESEFEFAPWLTPDGQAVVYTTWSDVQGGRVRRVALAGGEPETLVSWPGHYASAALSPDGKEVVFERVGGDTYRGDRFAEEPGIYRQKLGEESSRRFVVRNGRRPRFSQNGRRIWLHGREGSRHALLSVDRIGSDRRVHALSERAVDFVPSPDEKWLAFEEEWQVYLVPLPPGPTPLELAPGGKRVPQRRLSDVAGTYISFAGDSTRVRYSLGANCFDVPVAAPATNTPEPHDDAAGEALPRGAGAPAISLGFTQPADSPATNVYLVGGRIAPMHDLSVIDDGVVHVRGNRIQAVGTRVQVPVPDGAQVIDCSGLTVMPGLVDVHSHTGSSNHGLHAQQSWALLAMLAFGVTTTHDPSNDTQMIHAEAELVRTGRRVGPRLFSTGTILYGAEGEQRAVVNSYQDAREAIERTQAWGARSVKSYMQPRRDQRQQVMKAAAELGVMVMPEGGSTLHLNITQILDGHTTLEHALPVAPLYAPDLDLLASSGTCYTPTLVVGYGGIWGENYWYAKTRVWEHDRLLAFVPRSVVDPRARRRTLLGDEGEYHHLRLAQGAAEVVRRGGTVEIGAHGQMQGLGAHWETWMLAQGGLSAHEALRCATFGGARALCLEGQIGCISPGALADLIVVAGRPLEDVRHSERVVYTIANGRLFQASTLEQRLPDLRPLPAGPPLDTIREGPGHAHCACGR